MIRNKDGINFDEGIPLVDLTEFETLYVQCHEKQQIEFISWLTDSTSPLLVGGQIGTGKSTFINKTFSDSSIYPDLTFHFDQDSIDIFENNPLIIIVKEIIIKALNENIDLSFTNPLYELTDGQVSDWQNLIEIFQLNDFSLNVYNIKKNIAQKLQLNEDFVLGIMREVISRIEGKMGHKIFCFASGFDKYSKANVEFYFLNSVSLFLSKYKTLFEVNAVHIFDNTWALKSCQKIFLSSLNNDIVKEILKKRMGVYSFSIDEIINNLCALSGGNLRQALRLLTNYTMMKYNYETLESCLIATAKKTSQDFFAFASRPSEELMKYIFKEKIISATTISLPGDKETAQRSIYQNWIFIYEHFEGDKWKVDLNPLVQHLFLNSNEITNYETVLLNSYAQSNQISSYGLTFGNQLQSKTPLVEELKKSLSDSYVFNTAEILHMISAALLSTDRTDRIIIAYRDKEITEVVRDYIFAKANSFEYQSFFHTEIVMSDISVQNQLLEAIKKNDVNIYSFSFSSGLNDNDIEVVDKMRDVFLSYQMIWWLQIDDLKYYLPKWTQLRQLFEIFILEDELLASINKNEIEEDLKAYSELKLKSKNISITMGSLAKVLLWLKGKE
ncbi:MAG: hypothetical protein WCS69_10310 [Ignavibacteriaceae bacterium]|jgi:hypothetical protein